ncbi:TetR/AcrR family transcriptional regulator [Spiribacter halobius]|uniref:TetR/AcrR family transcriptional regulator n=1 Tax=Sediminicurvatus halobius TaxID=2182432 RepID=A0A2U2MZZ4_9GAMM|nr:TetR family transcriptional regulator [Spiribacter halobius]PWG62378.1 TetR/AcrR family transcriptional regulator [Spiribacter halobius]UEX79475.1 TetR family transcriptional regulator [Spiribacter halobius]
MNESNARQSLSAEDWADAALEAIAESGIKGVAVEPLARRLGVTKGSFYWHFANRRALLEAALRLWEQRETDAVLARAAEEQDPRKRLARLFREADGSQRAGRLYLALTGATENRFVQVVVRRVMEERIGFLRQCYAAMGLDANEAHDRAVLAYSVFLGTLQMRRDAPDVVPSGEHFHQYMHFIGEALIPGYRPELVRREGTGAGAVASATVNVGTNTRGDVS